MSSLLVTMALILVLVRVAICDQLALTTDSSDAVVHRVIGNQFMLWRRLTALSRDSSLPPPINQPAVRLDQLLFEYEIHRQFGKGGFGETWTAVRITRQFGHPQSMAPRSHFTHTLLTNLASGQSPFEFEDGVDFELFVLKRFLPRESRPFGALREEHFGQLLKGSEHIARFEECFEEEGDQWCVYRHEGKSLYSLLYVSTESVVAVSDQWRQLKLESESLLAEKGQCQMYWTQFQSIIYQLLEAVAVCHANNVTHRDIKPSNILLKTGRQHVTGDPPHRHRPGTDYLTLADFGSAVDSVSLKRFYPIYGPTKEEETLDYAPPETLFSQQPFAIYAPTAYDMWSIGVLILEMVLGTSDVFQIDRRTKAIINQHLKGESAELHELAFKFRGLFEFCIYDPTRHGKSMEMRGLDTHQACSNKDMQQLLVKLDPLSIGAPSVDCIRLIRRLLKWDPLSRLTAKEALQHSWFHGPFECDRCHSKFEFKSHLDEHQCDDTIEAQRISLWKSK